MGDKVPEIVKEAHNELPHFKDGRIDYTDADKIPVVAVFLKNGNRILILKRSDKVGTYRNQWSIVVGYFDELESVIEKGLSEVKEETGVKRDLISSIKAKSIYLYQIEREGVEYVSHLLLAELEKKPKIELNWEHTDYKWIKTKEAKYYLSPRATEELRIVLSD